MKKGLIRCQRFPQVISVKFLDCVIVRKQFIHSVKRVHILSYSGPNFSRIVPHSDWIRRDTEFLSVFSPNAGKSGKNADQNNSEYGLFLSSD